MDSGMGWKLSDLLGPRIVFSNMTSNWRPGTNSIHQGFLLCPVLLNIFVPDLSDGTLSCTQQVCSWYKTQRSGWYIRGLCCCSETCYHAGEKRRSKLCEVQWRQNAKFYIWFGITSCVWYMHQVYSGPGWLESSFSEKDLKFLVDGSSALSWQKRYKNFLGFRGKWLFHSVYY